MTVDCYAHFVGSYILVRVTEVDVLELGISGSRSSNSLVIYVEVRDTVEYLT